MMVELIFKDEVYTLVGAAMEVYNELGPGFLEAVYQEAYEIEMLSRTIPFVAQQELSVRYKAQHLRKRYIADFVAYGKIVIEIKAMDILTSREEAQMINYLKATGYQVGLLINFGSQHKLEWKRLVLTKDLRSFA